ncbi:nucleotide exchange factor GrpE [Conexibacter sp. DBS9H8]|uniref:nucleotide exchange factor GrpE n=1 Tax=Conexibacter sp. DBS9H8 TaxID=2937801 RepID=UPI00200D79DF|nr:nucleotide exchange factor GrpE [Conexibacter sp. DBS9H8]
MSAHRHEPRPAAADPGSAADPAASAPEEPSPGAEAGTAPDPAAGVDTPPGPAGQAPNPAGQAPGPAGQAPGPAGVGDDAAGGASGPTGVGADASGTDAGGPPAAAADLHGATAPEPGGDGRTEVDELAAATARAEEYLGLAQRTKADFDNYRKRAARDAALAAERGVLKLVKELLPALDNLERAITHAPAEDPLLEGIKLVHSDLLGALARAGIEAYSPAGESFDPQLHEAVAQHSREGIEAGTVIEVYQQGYRLADTVLRPARVLVAA